MHTMHKMEMNMKTFTLANRRYLGCKTKLIDYIHEIIDENCGTVKSVADIFAGTGVVGYSFYDECSVIVNDTLESNYVSYEAFFSRDKVSKKKLSQIIEGYNSLQAEQDNYYSDNFADTYLSRENMKKVGFIRDDIDAKYNNQEINSRERSILITSLLFAIDRIANTVGHYDAYRANGKLDVALELMMPNIRNNKYKHHYYKEDANELVKNIKADLVYIDPPYNSRQYCDAYHFLENVAENKKPDVFGVAKKMKRGTLKSKYCTKKAADELSDLINSINAKFILLSYNNTGDKNNDRSNAKITDDDILEILNKKGVVKVFEKDFNLFTTGKSKQDNHKERLFLCIVGKNNKSTYTGDVNDTQSPLNYTGGKFKLLNQLRARFPQDVYHFYDIFCGGCNVAANINALDITCVDNNVQLISLLNYLKQTNYEDVVTQVETKISYYGLSNTYKYGYEHYNCESGKGLGSFNKNPFLRLREDYNSSSAKSDILFLVLIIYSFNNQIRFNSNGEFNLPVGKRDFNSNVRKKLKQFITNIHNKNISFIFSDYRQIELNPDSANTFLYLDPPYFLGDAAYNENGGWTEKDERDLLRFLTACDEKGYRFALSNAIEHKGEKHQLLIDWCLENGYNINYIDASYQNSNYHKIDRNSVTREVLITNY